MSTSTFLPNSAKPTTAKAGTMKSKMTPALVHGARKRILLVDADADSQSRRAGMLRVRGVEVTCASTMKQAQLLWQADSYNLVMIDATNDYDNSMALHKSIKDERPAQLVTFLVGKPGFLSESPLHDDAPAESERNVSGMTGAHMVLTKASDKFSRGTGIMNAASQISTRRAILKLQTSNQTIAKAHQELSFGEQVRRAGGD